MKLLVEFSEETIDKIAKKVAAINQEKKPRREVIIPSKKDFQYTVAEVAEMTKQSKQTITRHCRDGLITATKVAKSWKITQENYLIYINNGNTEN